LSNNAVGEREWLLGIAAAMIELAVSDLVLGRGHEECTGRARRARDAMEWVFGREDALLSFSSVCSILGLDVSATRAAIRRKWE
jgi:hypothetical protein